MKQTRKRWREGVVIGSFEILGTSNRSSYVRVKCLECGEVQELSTGCVRKRKSHGCQFCNRTAGPLPGPFQVDLAHQRAAKRLSRLRLVTARDRHADRLHVCEVDPELTAITVCGFQVIRIEEALNVATLREYIDPCTPCLVFLERVLAKCAERSPVTTTPIL